MGGQSRQQSGQVKTEPRQIASQKDVGHNAHDKHHAGNSVFRPIEIQLPVNRPTYNPVIEIVTPDPIEAASQVPDSSGAFAMLGLGLIAIAIMRRFK